MARCESPKVIQKVIQGLIQRIQKMIQGLIQDYVRNRRRNRCGVPQRSHWCLREGQAVGGSPAIDTADGLQGAYPLIPEGSNPLEWVTSMGFSSPPWVTLWVGYFVGYFVDNL